LNLTLICHCNGYAIFSRRSERFAN